MEGAWLALTGETFAAFGGGSQKLRESAVAAQRVERLVQRHPREQAPPEHRQCRERALEPYQGQLRVAQQRVGAADVVVHEIVVGADDDGAARPLLAPQARSEEHTSELQSLMRIPYA